MAFTIVLAIYMLTDILSNVIKGYTPNIDYFLYFLFVLSLGITEVTVGFLINAYRKMK